MNKIKQIIKDLDLKAHPEGGYFRETYRSKGEIMIPDKGFEGIRNYATCIYFLLSSETFSAFHRIKQDEIWHFYDGSPLNLHLITESGNYSKYIIGNKIEDGQQPQFVVPAQTWFAANVINQNDFSLVGCTVAPGFDFKDFELPTRKELLNKFPKHQKIITQLSRS